VPNDTKNNRYLKPPAATAFRGALTVELAHTFCEVRLERNGEPGTGLPRPASDQKRIPQLTGQPIPAQ
jgi:hypothetical protein